MVDVHDETPVSLRRRCPCSRFHAAEVQDNFEVPYLHMDSIQENNVFSVGLTAVECQHTSPFSLRHTAIDREQSIADYVLRHGTPHIWIPTMRHPPASLRWIRLVRSWAGDIAGSDLISEIRSSGRVEFVNVDISTAAGMSCDRILVSPS